MKKEYEELSMALWSLDKSPSYEEKGKDGH